MKNCIGAFILSIVKKTGYFVIPLLFLLIQVALFLWFGVRTPVDSEMYIQDAQVWLKGSVPDEGRSIWYAGYSLLLALIFLLKGSLQEMVYLQIAFSGIAAYCVYGITKEIYRSKLQAFIAVFLYIGWFKIHQWNMYIYTESLFTSFCIICFYFLIKSKKTWHYMLTGALLVFTFFIRPSGFAFFAGLLIYAASFVLKGNFSKKSKLVFVSAGLILTLLILNKMLGFYLSDSDYYLPVIIYPNESLGISAPHDLRIPDQDLAPLVRLLLYMVYNPLYFLKLALIKTVLFLGHVKPYYSLAHNLLIGLVLYPLYAMAVYGFKFFPENRLEHFWIAGYVFTQTTTVALLTENWDGRFLLPVLPFVFILASGGIDKLVKYLSPDSINLKGIMTRLF